MGAKSVKLNADLSALGKFRSAKAHVVTGDDPWTTNHIADPERIVVETRTARIAGGTLRWDVPAFSASVILLS